MKEQLILYSSELDTHSAVLDEFEERIVDLAFHHYASELLEKCLRDESELDEALQKTLTALSAAHLPCRHHVKKVFISYGDSLRNDWLVSDLAFRMIIMNADAHNPVVARLQVELMNARQ